MRQQLAMRWFGCVDSNHLVQLLIDTQLTRTGAIGGRPTSG